MIQHKQLAMLAMYFVDQFIFYQINCLLIDIFDLKLSLANFDYRLRIPVPYSEYKGREFKTNTIICALLRMPYSVQRYVLLEMPYLEQYMMKLGKLIRVIEFRLGNAVIRSRALGVGFATIQSYPKRGTTIRSAQLRTSALSEAWLRIYSAWNKSKYV